MKRRFISVLLALTMLFSVVMPATVHVIAEEAESATELVLWDFEDGADDWTFVDADGDGHNWMYHSNEGLESGRLTAYNGDGLIYSQSYDNDTASALNPENWAVSPALSLKNTSDATLSLWARGQDANYALEVFALYAGVSPEPSAMTKVGGDFTASGEYLNYTADLSDFVGADT
ncbi:MAG: choice-of-anchor J domain-containing protein, partial [Clostridia bacterium]|nr:choice-of-anchor J domain-containing protein [Clostridia bacterium]